MEYPNYCTTFLHLSSILLVFRLCLGANIIYFDGKDTFIHSTVTDLAKFLGWSTFLPLQTAT